MVVLRNGKLHFINVNLDLKLCFRVVTKWRQFLECA